MRIQRNPGFGRLVSGAAIGLLLVTAAACGGSAAPPVATSQTPVSAADPTDPPGGAGLPSAADSTATVTTVDVAREAWFAGFHLTFGTATAEITARRGGTVEIEATFENTGEDAARLDATIALVSGGKTAREGFNQDIPSVAGEASAKGLFAFDVDDTFSFDDAVLTLGRSSIQQAVVPLKSDATAAVSLEPKTVSVSGSGAAGDLKLQVRGGEIRADRPWSHGQQKEGSLVLTLNYDASFTSGFAGGFAFTGENVALRLPDGTTVGTIQDGLSQSNELLGPNATKKDLLSRFEISDPAPGSYVLLVRNSGSPDAQIPFTLS